MVPTQQYRKHFGNARFPWRFSPRRGKSNRGMGTGESKNKGEGEKRGRRENLPLSLPTNIDI